jgi:hypothetical protein
MHDDSKRNVHLSENPTSPALISPPLFLPLLLLLRLLLLFPAAYSARVVDSLPKTLIPSSHQVALQKKSFRNKTPLKNNKTQIRNNKPQLPTTYVKKKNC